MKPITAPGVEALRRDPKLYQAARELMDGINGTRKGLERGDYAASPQYGRWGTVWCGVTSMRDVAGWPPTWASASAGYLPRFASNATMSGTVEVPESFRGGEAFVPTLVFTFDTTPTGGDVYTWYLSVSYASALSRFPSVFSIVASHTADQGDSRRHCRLRMPLQKLELAPGAVVTFSLQRGATTTAVDPYVLGVSWAFQKQTFGQEDQP